MPQYRLILVDKDDRIVSATERECAEDDIQIVARDILQTEDATVAGVEVWQNNRRLEHLKRA